MDKSLMIEQLVNALYGGNKTRFAHALGLKPQTINGWILRNSFDAELIFSKCDGVSADWLLSGEGDMLRSSSQAVTASGHTSGASLHGNVTIHGNTIATEDAVLKERVALLERLISEKDRLLEEKERLITVLMEKR